MSLVYVVSEPLRYDAQRGQFVRTRDLSPARQYGDLVFLLPPGNEGPADPVVAVAVLTEKLAGFRSCDYLLPIGHPLYLAWAAAIAARVAGGTVRMLHWRPGPRRYDAVTAQLWREPAPGASLPSPRRVAGRAGDGV